MKTSFGLILWLVVYAECSRLRLNILAALKRHPRPSGCEEQKATFIETCHSQLPAQLDDTHRWASQYLPGGKNEEKWSEERKDRDQKAFHACSEVLFRDIGWPYRAFLAKPSMKPGRKKCRKPGFWTGGMDSSPGFSPWLRSHPEFCLLHHQEASSVQGSIFGLSMDAADCLSACERNVSRWAWQVGSQGYAEWHTEFRSIGMDYDVHPIYDMLWLYGRLKMGGVPKTEIQIFVGHKFGLKRSGADSILYSYELGAMIAALRDRALSGVTASAHYDGMEGFSGVSASTTWKDYMEKNPLKQRHGKEEHIARQKFEYGRKQMTGSFFRAVGQTYAGFEFLNFSPSQCTALLDIRVASPGGDPCTFRELLSKPRRFPGNFSSGEKVGCQATFYFSPKRWDAIERGNISSEDMVKKRGLEQQESQFDRDLIKFIKLNQEEYYKEANPDLFHNLRYTSILFPRNYIELTPEELTSYYKDEISSNAFTVACKDCFLADRVGGPTQEEIETCFRSKASIRLP